MTITQTIKHVLAAAIISGIGISAQAQSWPDKPITLVVAWPAGGGGDLVGRVIGEKLGEQLGQPVIIANRPGASGTIGTRSAAQAAPDGYTLLLGQANNNVIAPAVFDAGYRTTEAFTPITYIGYTPNVLVVSKDNPANSVQELIDLAKRTSDTSYASAGYGSIQAIAGAQFSRLANAPVTHIPYKGSSAIQTDLASGRVTLCFDTMPSVLPLINSGRLKALAVSTAKRVAALPDVPTYAEAGLQELKMTNWYSVMAPKGVAPEIVDKVNGAMQAVLKDPDTHEKLGAQGIIYDGPDTPAAFARFVAEEEQRYRTLVKELDIKAE